MFLLTKINIQKWNFNEEEQMNKDDCLHNRLNESSYETVDLSLSNWFKIEDRNQ